jgi:methionyl-tRNA formyltransferase
MVKIACLTQRPIQTIILLYLLGKYNYKFDIIIYSPLKDIKSKYNNEGSASIKALEYQCIMQNIPLVKINNLNSIKIIRLMKKNKIKTSFALITDTILNKKILNCFSKGVYMTHGGILPKFRGVDANKWALLKKEKFIGLTMIKLGAGVDNGDIIQVKKIKVKTNNIKKLESNLYYRFKLYMYKNLFIKIKNNKKVKLTKQKKTYPQYFEMHKSLEKLIDK